MSMLTNLLVKQRPVGLIASLSQRAAFSSSVPEPEYLTTFEQIRIKLTPWVNDRRHLSPNSHPTVAQRKPFKVELTPGQEYLWCACGQSKS